MSVRFFKILSAVFFGHLVLLNLIWVGFSAPAPRPPATFIYQGPLAAEDDGNGQDDIGPKAQASDQLTVDHSQDSYFNHWVTLRDPSRN